jgi:ribosomal protein S1
MDDVIEPTTSQSGWDMHGHGEELKRQAGAQRSKGASVTGTVVCHHPFGLGVHIDDCNEYGHVNITEIGVDPLRGPEDFPPIGSVVTATVLGYTGIHAQLRLTLKSAQTI